MIGGLGDGPMENGFSVGGFFMHEFEEYIAKDFQIAIEGEFLSLTDGVLFYAGFLHQGFLGFEAFDFEFALAVEGLLDEAYKMGWVLTIIENLVAEAGDFFFVGS